MKKWTHKTTTKKKVDPDLSYMKEDRILEKIEKYVDKNREETSQRISERKDKRNNTKLKKADLEVMISRISNESKPREKAKEISKWVLYIIYIIIFIVILIFLVKSFFTWKTPQIS